MGDLNPPEILPFNLPPGCRFYPSQDQIFTYYLTNKNNDGDDRVLGDDRVRDGDYDRFGFNLITETDFCSCDPFELPESGCFSYGYRGRKQHWYCYMPAKEGREGRRRRAGKGFWKMRGRVRNVFGRGKERVVLGTRTSFVFCLGNLGRNAVKTDWIMHQYALVDQLKAFVLCRIFVKSHSDYSLSDHVPSSCAEESVSATRPIGIQMEETVASNEAEAMASDNHLIGTDDDGLLGGLFPVSLVQEIEERITNSPFPVTRFQPPSNIYTNELVSIEDLFSILEEDFIEVDDLSSPLLGTDVIG